MHIIYIGNNVSGLVMSLSLLDSASDSEKEMTSGMWGSVHVYVIVHVICCVAINTVSFLQHQLS